MLLISQKLALITNHTFLSEVTALLTYVISNSLALFFFSFLVLPPIHFPKQHRLVLSLPVIYKWNHTVCILSFFASFAQNYVCLRFIRIITYGCHFLVSNDVWYSSVCSTILTILLLRDMWLLPGSSCYE